MINLKKIKSVGIIGFAGYLPYWRLATAKIAQAWQSINKAKTLGISQKAVAGLDEDALTMAVAACQTALCRAQIPSEKIGAVFMGSESNSYAVKPSGTIIADILGIGQEYFCADLQFACKAGTTALQITAGLIEAGIIDYGLAVSADKAQAKPGGILEYSASSGAAAFILGKKKKELAVKIKAVFSFNSDTPDFWRRQNHSFPSHAGRFTAEPAYFFHLEKGINNFLKKIKKKPSFFDNVILHMPNAKLPLKLAKKIGFNFKQLEKGFLVPLIGNPYTASSLLGLSAVLETITTPQNILLAAYGSGAGSDIFWLQTSKRLKNINKKGKTINYFLQHHQQISYLDYFKYYQLYQEK